MNSRVLFVDDDANFLSGLRRILRSHRQEWEMSFALSAADALDETAKGDYDAVISDVNMPGQDGFSLLQALRESPKTQGIPVIILTGAGDRDLKRRALDMGATDLLSKPVNAEDLVARIRNVLRLKSFQDEMKSQNDILDRRVKERTSELEQSRLDMIWRLAKVGEYHDVEAGEHIIRVAFYCRVLAEALGMAREFVELIFLTSPLHDIGKVGVPDDILLKDGALTTEERTIMQRHCAIGAEILQQNIHGRELFAAWQGDQPDLNATSSDNPLLKMASSIAMTHHEWWNGKGYPLGLATDQIPIEARIAGLADVYDALCSARPYKPAYSDDKALAIVRAECGTHFDPAICAAFEGTLERIREIRVTYSEEASAVV